MPFKTISHSIGMYFKKRQIISTLWDRKIDPVVDLVLEFAGTDSVPYGQRNDSVVHLDDNALFCNCPGFCSTVSFAFWSADSVLSCSMKPRQVRTFLLRNDIVPLLKGFIFEDLIDWSIDPLVHWSIGPLVHWSIGPLVHWLIGPLFH